ncbi:MAG: phosphatase PAP2 family protein [Firmicutes bacterium]|nr:phosphatase PAP2 family protein [Bacillota bacterium]
MKKPVVNYRTFSLDKLNGEFSYLKLLLFWPVHGLVFSFLEKGLFQQFYYPMHCVLDDIIPFCEWFFIPYLIWFLFIPAILIYGLLYEPKGFIKTMQFIIFSYAFTLFVYFVFPTCQNLRPASFARDNILTRMIARFYANDTNTNVFPSLHVLGSIAVSYGARFCEKLRRKKGWIAAIDFTAFLITISTCFVKQHSFLDVFSAVLVAVLTSALIREFDLQTASHAVVKRAA